MVCSLALSGRCECATCELPTVPDEHEAWNAAAYYLAQLCANLVYLTSVQRISIGGGVLNRASFLSNIRSHFLRIMNGYIQVDSVTDEEKLEKFICIPEW